MYWKRVGWDKCIYLSYGKNREYFWNEQGEQGEGATANWFAVKQVCTESEVESSPSSSSSQEEEEHGIA